MIFIGDIALPKGVISKVDYLPECFTQPVIANLEGVIAIKNSISTKDMKLFNDEDVLSFLKQINVKVVSLGNNHITDIPDSFENTKKLLDINDIAYCGAGYSFDEASKAAILKEGEKIYAFLSFGWDVIGCKYVGKYDLGVNPLEKDNVVKCIKNARKIYPEAKIIVLPHWDYELEIYPQPMHRELARIAIDAGADAIFGHHSHCVQGFEFYKSKPIIYSLGNWFIPSGVYSNGRSRFPEYSRTQVAIEWDGENIICHWFEYEPNEHELKYVKSEDLKESLYMKKMSCFSEMDIPEYIEWFKKNRKKKRLLPIYKYNDSYLENKVKDFWVISRQKIITTLFKLGLKRTRKGVK